MLVRADDPQSRKRVLFEHQVDAVQASFASAPWKCVAGRSLGNRWQACVISLPALPVHATQPVLAASLAPLSVLGIATAQRIAQVEGAEESIRLDDCCCAQSALAAAKLINRHDTALGNDPPLIRFDSGNNA